MVEVEAVSRPTEVVCCDNVPKWNMSDILRMHQFQNNWNIILEGCLK